MKNPFLLFIFWLLSFLLEISFAWEFAGISFRPWGSYFILCYIFFTLPLIESLLLLALAFLFHNSFSSMEVLFLFQGSILIFLIHFIRRQTFTDHGFARAILVYCLVLGVAYVLPVTTIHDWSLTEVWGGLRSIPEVLMNLFLCLYLLWWLEERGGLLEEKLFSFRAKKGQLDLFEARHLQANSFRKRFKVQRRIRRRFGFDRKW
ncbi:MAG: hypothetical protein JNK65_06475 [Deltaproteobacteria bacterium]|nr:hypothetical protein [Deltaproteobacteria bacterium]